jgi:hypothetical protein
MKDKLVRYLRKSYFSVDGLWFLKVEERDGLDNALEVDKEVWKIMPKIQAREIKKILGLRENDIRSLRKAVLFKFKTEGYEVKEEYKDNSFWVRILLCPWFEIMKSSGREHLAEKISKNICVPEFRIWAQEFGTNISYRFEKHKCLGEEYCELFFEEC